jgi:endonuclease/exonuclease/phosphatase (EEP) superfamily protein YafD
VLELPGHFRMQLFLGLALAAAAVLGCGRIRAGAVFAAAALFNASYWLPLYRSDTGPMVEAAPPAYAAVGPRLRMLLFNVNHRSGEPAAVRSYLEREDFDLIVLQEYTHRLAAALAAVPYGFKVERAREDAFGMAVLSRLPITEASILYLDSVGIPSIRAELDVSGRRVQLLATHPLPPVTATSTASRDRQLAALSLAVPSTGAFVLAGDLNSTPWSQQLRALRGRTGLRDSVRGFGFQPTWPAALPPLWVPIDHVLHGSELTVLERSIGPACGSDHFPVEVTFALTATGA